MSVETTIERSAQMTQKTSPFELEILKNRFKAITEEMAAVNLRTAFTVYIKESSDFGCALVSSDGDVFATATDHSDNCMVGVPTREALEALAPYHPGDLGIANDPASTGGMSTHLPDIWLWKPIFVEEELIGFAMSYIHSSDVGGRVPGSIAMRSGEVYEEGLRIPPMRIYDRGKVNAEVRDIIRLNSRIGEHLWGDIQAQVAAVNRGDQRILEIVKRYGKQTVVNGIQDVLNLAEARSRAIISGIPDGQYNVVDYLENEEFCPRPIRFECTMRIRGDEMELDFTGTDIEVRAALNLPTFGHPVHYQLMAPIRYMLMTLEPSIPYNSGMLRPVVFSAPSGTIINPRPGVATGVRYATSLRAQDCIMACLFQAMPDRMPAGGPGAAGIIVVSSHDPATGVRHVAVAQPFLGGSGARPGKDGVDGKTYGGAAHLYNVPNEVLETDMAVLVENYGFVVDSGAAGRFRGGLAVEFQMRALDDETVLATRGLERFRFQPWGVRGGDPGSNGSVVLNPGTADEVSIGRPDSVTLNAGDVIRFRSSSGGGYGSPLQRDLAQVDRDLAAGYVSARAATERYGVVLDTAGGIDHRATAERRAERGREAQPEDTSFSFGAARARYEKLLPQAVQRRLIERLLELPAVRRHALDERVMKMIERTDRSAELTVEELDRVIDGLLEAPARAVA